jgi:serine/threonine-protein kinase RsbW
MALGMVESCGQTTDRGLEASRSWECSSSLEQTRPVVEFVTTAMARAGYPDSDIFEMRLALDEALDNAVRHGNGGDPDKLVRVRCDIDRERALAEVSDQGSGFDFRVIDGHGLALMRLCLSWLRHTDRGSVVTLCKYRSDL